MPGRYVSYVSFILHVCVYAQLIPYTCHRYTKSALPNAPPSDPYPPTTRAVEQYTEEEYKIIGVGLLHHPLPGGALRRPKWRPSLVAAIGIHQ